MIIRPATPRDGAAIAGLINQIICDTTITFTTIEKTAEGMTGAIETAGGAYHVAEIDGHVVGYASHGPFRPGPGYAATRELSITLAEEAWGRGVGRALMAAIEIHARGAGVHVLIAGISAENAPGLAFHAAMGFEEVGHLPQVGRKFDRWLGLVLMQKFL